MTNAEFRKTFGTNPEQVYVNIGYAARGLFGDDATTLVTRVADKRWTLTLDVGALQLTWTQPTRREVLAEAYGLLSRMAVGS